MENSFRKLVLPTMSTVLMIMFLFGSVSSPSAVSNLISKVRSSLNRSSADQESADQKPAAFKQIIIKTTKGDIEAKYYKTPKATKRGVVFVSGSSGGWDGPGHRAPDGSGLMYPELGPILKQEGIASLHIKYRNTNHLDDCTFDALEGLKYLKKQGIESAGIVGHSFGGAVICQAAGREETGMVKAIVALATVSKQVELIAAVKGETLLKGVASLFIHGTRDISIPISASETVHGLARGPKELMTHFIDTHGFRDKKVVEEIEKEIVKWFNTYL